MQDRGEGDERRKQRALTLHYGQNESRDKYLADLASMCVSRSPNGGNTLRKLDRNYSSDRQKIDCCCHLGSMENIRSDQQSRIADGIQAVTNSKESEDDYFFSVDRQCKSIGIRSRQRVAVEGLCVPSCQIGGL